MIMSYYLEEYRRLRRSIMNNIIKEVKNMNSMNERCNMKFSMRDVTSILTKIIPNKSPGHMVSFGKDIAFARTFVYALTCD